MRASIVRDADCNKPVAVLLNPETPFSASALQELRNSSQAGPTSLVVFDEQEMSVWNCHYACTCYHPLFVFNQFGDLERCALRAGNVHSADNWYDVLKPVVARYQRKVSGNLDRPTERLQCTKARDAGDAPDRRRPRRHPAGRGALFDVALRPVSRLVRVGEHRVFKEWADRYSGRFDQGYDTALACPASSRTGLRGRRPVGR